MDKEFEVVVSKKKRNKCHKHHSKTFHAPNRKLKIGGYDELRDVTKPPETREQHQKPNPIQSNTYSSSSYHFQKRNPTCKTSSFAGLPSLVSILKKSSCVEVGAVQTECTKTHAQLEKEILSTVFHHNSIPSCRKTRSHLNAPSIPHHDTDIKDHVEKKPKKVNFTSVKYFPIIAQNGRNTKTVMEQACLERQRLEEKERLRMANLQTCMANVASSSKKNISSDQNDDLDIEIIFSDEGLPFIPDEFDACTEFRKLTLKWD